MRFFKIKHTYFLVFIYLLFINPVVATESDAYTYQYIEINDSAPQVNSIINQILSTAVEKTNQHIKKKRKKNKKFKPTNKLVEYLLAINYYKLIFSGNLKDDVFSEFEKCIDSNSCPGWPYFERILIYPHESIYSKANYSYITNRFVASTVNLCGVRMGSDKLTHFLMDGFVFYNGSKDDRLNLNLEDILHISNLFEQGIMGTQFTGVYSQADIEANVKGAQFFKDFVNKHIKYLNNSEQVYLMNQEMNICNYVNDHFNEIKNPNIYLAEKVAELEQAKKLHINIVTTENILSRRIVQKKLKVRYSIFKHEHPLLFFKTYLSNKLNKGVETWRLQKPSFHHRK